MHHPGKEQRVRQQVAQLAARIMAEEGVSDFHIAKRKAAKRMRVTGEQSMPRNVEIELALRGYQALFKQGEQASQLRALRETALEIMQRLEKFSPRLVGPVLRGTADRHSALSLHLFTDNQEELNWALMEQHVPFNVDERQFRFGGEDELRNQPLFTVSADGIDIEMAVFPANGIRQSPKSPLDGKQIQRASISDVKVLLQQQELD